MNPLRAVRYTIAPRAADVPDGRAPAHDDGCRPRNTLREVDFLPGMKRAPGKRMSRDHIR